MGGGTFAIKEGNAQDVAVTNDSAYVTAVGLGVEMFTINAMTGGLE